MRLKLGFSGLSIPAMIVRARNIIAKITGNIFFPNPNPTLADATSAVDATEVAYNDAIYGGKILKSILYLRVFAMLNIFRRMGAYVQAESGGDEEIILSSGFDVVRRGEPIIVGQVINLRTVDGPYVGSIHAIWDPVRGARAYIVEISDVSQNGPYSQYLVVVKTRIDIIGLEAGKAYWVRVTAVGRSGYGLPSDPSIHLASVSY